MNKTSLDAPTTTTVAALSDQRLLQRVKELAAIEHRIESVVLDHLRELERRHLYLALGFSSMFDYAVRELGYSNGGAWRRLKAMRLYEVEGARTRLQEGTLTLDAAAQLQHAFERQERKANRATAPVTGKQEGARRGAEAGDGSPGAEAAATPGESESDAPARGAEAARSAGAPGGLAANVPVHAAESDAAPVPDTAEREALVARAAGKSTRQVQEMLAEVDPELARAADRMRPLGAGRWELKAVIDDDCQLGLEQLKGLLSHVDPQMTLGQLLGRVVEEALDRHDPSRPPRGRRRRRRPPDVTAETSAPKDAPGPNAAAVPRSALPAGAATSPANVPKAPGHHRATVVKRSAAATRTADATEETSAPKDLTGQNGAAAPWAGTETSAPKLGCGPWRQAAPAAPASRIGRFATASTAPPQPRVRSRAIPAAVRRQVWERDRAAAATWTGAAGAAAAPGICWR